MLDLKNQSKKRETAQGMVEFALALPIFLVVVFGIIEMSRFFFVYSSVYTASREAARYGSSVGETMSGTTHDQDCAGIIQTALDTGFFSGISASDVTVTYETIPGTTKGTCPSVTELGDRVVVQVTSTYQPIFGIMPAIPITASNGRTIMKDIDILGTPPPTPMPRTPVPMPPVVDAGPDDALDLPARDYTLDGTVTVDGGPPPASLVITWSVISGPGTVSFDDNTIEDPTIHFHGAHGVYVLEIKAQNGVHIDTDTVTITLYPENHGPIVDAGPNITITLPANAALNGTVTDDGYPAPPTLNFAWTVDSGPGGTVSFDTPNNEDTNASFSQPGIYILRLTADDTALAGTDTVQVTVLSGPTATPTQTLTPTVTPTITPTPTPTPITPTPTPVINYCENLTYSYLVTEDTKLGYKVIYMGDATYPTAYMIGLSVSWDRQNVNKFAGLDQVLWNNSAVWDDYALSQLVLSDESQFIAGVDRSLTPNSQKDLLFVFDDGWILNPVANIVMQVGNETCQMTIWGN